MEYTEGGGGWMVGSKQIFDSGDRCLFAVSVTVRAQTKTKAQRGTQDTRTIFLY